MTPQQVIKLAESMPGLTPKERQKTLALAITKIAKNTMECSMLWDFSTMIIRHNGYIIPDFDPQFILEINQNPLKFKDYK